MARPSDPPLRRRDVISCALAMIDRDGLEKFTIRKLAAELDISGPTLYHHFRNKDDILAAVAKLIMADQVPGDPHADPIDAIVEHSTTYYLALLEHRHALRLVERESRTHSMPWYEYLVGLLADAGVPTQDRALVIDALDALIQGFVSLAGRDDRSYDAAQLCQFPLLEEALAADCHRDTDRLQSSVRALLGGWVVPAATHQGARPRSHASTSAT
jgi:TetR/AcrR family tetracycline transcriptional repressor